MNILPQKQHKNKHQTRWFGVYEILLCWPTKKQTRLGTVRGDPCQLPCQCHIGFVHAHPARYIFNRRLDRRSLVAQLSYQHPKPRPDPTVKIPSVGAIIGRCFKNVLLIPHPSCPQNCPPNACYCTRDRNLCGKQTQAPNFATRAPRWDLHQVLGCYHGTTGGQYLDGFSNRHKADTKGKEEPHHADATSNANSIAPATVAPLYAPPPRTAQAHRLQACHLQRLREHLRSSNLFYICATDLSSKVA